MAHSVIAVYPGTFDPMTLGHEDVVRRATQLFDRVIVAVAAGHHKKAMFTLQERIEMAREVVRQYPQVEVESFSGLLRDFVVARGGKAMVRGLRAVTDFDYEFQLAGMNRSLMPDVETVFLTPSDKYQFISSTFVREIAVLGGEVDKFVSPVGAATPGREGAQPGPRINAGLAPESASGNLLEPVHQRGIHQRGFFHGEHVAAARHHDQLRAGHQGSNLVRALGRRELVGVAAHHQRGAAQPRQVQACIRAGHDGAVLADQLVCARTPAQTQGRRRSALRPAPGRGGRPAPRWARSPRAPGLLQTARSRPRAKHACHLSRAGHWCPAAPAPRMRCGAWRAASMATMPPMEAPHSTSSPACCASSAAAMASIVSWWRLTSATRGCQGLARASSWARHISASAARPGSNTSVGRLRLMG
jgi:pantetheine-phosphate adenylyltransferase